jgi:hypothetical protein
MVTALNISEREVTALRVLQQFYKARATAARIPCRARA